MGERRTKNLLSVYQQKLCKGALYKLLSQLHKHVVMHDFFYVAGFSNSYHLLLPRSLVRYTFIQQVRH